jgi:caffeoyl-CoA O-methyltransferase
MARARQYWSDAGQAQRITGHVRPATETLDRFLKEGAGGTYDFAFIDADKLSYDAYYERMLRLVRPGGLIAIDNVLWSGQVADPTDMSEETGALRALNAKIKDDPRVDAMLLPIADGLFLCRKR